MTADLILSANGLAYDVGGGMFAELPPAKGWKVKILPNGFEVELDTDGDGTTDRVFFLRDRNGDGNFSGTNEVQEEF